MTGLFAILAAFEYWRWAAPLLRYADRCLERFAIADLEGRLWREEQNRLESAEEPIYCDDRRRRPARSGTMHGRQCARRP